jgi:hypothetical protein
MKSRTSGAHHGAVQGDREAIGLQDRSCGHAGRLQLAAQRGQGHAQVVAPGVGGGVGPQAVRKYFARHRALVQRQPHQQSSRLARAKAGDPLAFPLAARRVQALQRQPAEHLDTPHHASSRYLRRPCQTFYHTPPLAVRSCCAGKYLAGAAS